jgi:predicted CoA-binding protein
MEDDIGAILRLNTWAVVGLSDDPWRASHSVAKELVMRGYEVIPVNPALEEVLGRTSYKALADIPVPVDVVDIFRRSDQAGAHVDEAIAIGAKAVWMQLGVIDDQAAERARAAGLRVVMNRCPSQEFFRGRGR